MGSFIGHAIPGSFFFMFGIWWLTQVMRRYFRCRQEGTAFRSTLTYDVRVCPGRRMRNVPVESLVKIVACLLGIVVEIIGGINSVTHRFDNVGNVQHITMYFFFLLTGVLDILTAKGLAPPGSDYMGVVLALLIEGALFKFHLFGRSDLDVLVHVLLLYVIGFSAILICVEAAYRTAPVLPMLRALLCMVQGTWFWALGTILYNPLPDAVPWDQHDHTSLMLAVVCFSWHVAANFLVLLAFGAVMACCYRKRGGAHARYASLPLKSLDDEEEDGERLVGEAECCLGGAEDGPGGDEAGTPKKGVRVYRDEVKVKADGKDGSGLQGQGRREEEEEESDMEFQAPVRKGEP